MLENENDDDDDDDEEGQNAQNMCNDSPLLYMLYLSYYCCVILSLVTGESAEKMNPNSTRPRRDST